MSEDPVQPLKVRPLRYQTTTGVGEPLTLALKVTLEPVGAVWLTGWVTKSGAPSPDGGGAAVTESRRWLLIPVPAGLEATTE